MTHAYNKKVPTHPGMGKLRISLAQPPLAGFTSSFTWCCWSGPATGSIWVPTSWDDEGAGAAACKTLFAVPLAPGPAPSPPAPDCCCCWCCCCCCCCDKATWCTATACCWFSYTQGNEGYFNHWNLTCDNLLESSHIYCTQGLINTANLLHFTVWGMCLLKLYMQDTLLPHDYQNDLQAVS